MLHPDITIEPELREKCPQLQAGCLIAQVQVAPASPRLLQEMERACEEASRSLAIEDISRLPRIRSAREAYKATGKKPGRYRPSAEALLRRVVSGKGLYRISNVVDVINLCSLTTHYSIGGYDTGSIAGPITMGIGREGEPYEAIARGALNIAGLPVLRDEQGAFGSPTSDSSRAMIRVRDESVRILLVYFNFGGHQGLDAVLEDTATLLETHCAGKEIEVWI
ncbi:MAG: hypothetical protein KDD10_15600 [Phaeodactylibacter sp.]|nr:hypothetical protein [Phaeodactylibacter sp.]MCB9294519.1 hypothetical protein [Lewinellaceae bacterium]